MEAKLEIEPDKEKPYGEFEKYEIEHAVNTLQEAEKIRNNPKIMKYVFPLLLEQKQASDKAYQAAEVLYGKTEKEEGGNE